MFFQQGYLICIGDWTALNWLLKTCLIAAVYWPHLFLKHRGFRNHRVLLALWNYPPPHKRIWQPAEREQMALNHASVTSLQEETLSTPHTVSPIFYPLLERRSIRFRESFHGWKGFCVFRMWEDLKQRWMNIVNCMMQTWLDQFLWSSFLISFCEAAVRLSSESSLLHNCPCPCAAPQAYSLSSEWHAANRTEDTIRPYAAL